MASLLVSGIFLTPAYAKGISKAVKKEYVKILKKGIVEDDGGGFKQDNIRFKIVDLNNDGKADLIAETFQNMHRDKEYAIYLNYGNKVIESKINSPDEYEVIAAGESIKSYKNYVMAINWHSSNDLLCQDIIYKIDNKGNLNTLYYHYYVLYDEDDGRKEITKERKYQKVVNGRFKKVSKKEFDKFASKFKKIKGKWHDWTLENIEKYVSSIKPDFNVSGNKSKTKKKLVNKAQKNLKAHLAYEKLLKKFKSNSLKVFSDKTYLPKHKYWYGCKFAYHDFDGDKVDELICNFGCDAWQGCIGTYREFIYTYKNGKETKILDSNNPTSENDYDFDRPYIHESLIENSIISKIENGKVLIVEKTADMSLDYENWKKYYSGYKVKLVDVTKANLKKYRKTYNSKNFRFKG